MRTAKLRAAARLVTLPAVIPLIVAVAACAANAQQKPAAQANTAKRSIARRTHGPTHAISPAGYAVQSWGSNAFNQLGYLDGASSVAAPQPITTLPAIVSISGGESGLSTNGIASDGTLWVWGSNASGQLGVPNQRYYPSPSHVTSFTNVTSVASGSEVTVASTAGGSVYAWGTNGYGEFGAGFDAGQVVTTPTTIAGLPAIASVAAGVGVVMAVGTDGFVYTVGNGLVSLNGGATGGPVYRIPGVTGAVQVSVADRHALACLSNGAVWAWGNNYHGALGNGSSNTSSTPPAQVAGLSGVIQVAAGYDFSLALTSDGAVWAWGSNDVGQVGDGSTVNRLSPVKVNCPATIVAIAAGRFHALALASDGVVWFWGSDAFGQAGDGLSPTPPFCRLTPQPVPGLLASAITVSSDHCVAIRQDGALVSWGLNELGETADQYQDIHPSPAPMQSLTNVVSMAEPKASAQGGFALLADGSVNAVPSSALPVAYWAPTPEPLPLLENVVGASYTTGAYMFALANGSVIYSYVGLELWENAPPPMAGISGAAGVGAGPDFGLALLSDGTVWGWGDDAADQLGDGGSTETVTTPVETVFGGVDFIDIEPTGTSTTYLLAADGTVWSLGDSIYFGQIAGLSNIVAISASLEHTLALDANGVVWAWGSNAFGECGQTGVTKVNTPTAVTGLGKVVAIAAGGGDDTAYVLNYPNAGPFFSAAVLSDGRVWTWGGNAWGNLGTGAADLDAHPTPTQVPGLANVVKVFASGGAVFALTPAAGVSGNVTLQGISATAPSQTLAFQFRPHDARLAFNRTAVVDATGAFSFPEIPAGVYDIAVKGPKWLQGVVTVDTAGGPVTNAAVTLLTGDINGDNVVDLNDFSAFIEDFGQFVNPAVPADLNCDGVVNLNDFSLLATNYGQTGAP